MRPVTQWHVPRTAGNGRRSLLWLLLLPVVLLSPLASHASSGSGLVPVAQSRLDFAVADFDGDNRADFASVQPGRQDSGQFVDYVRLSLSTSGKQFIRIAAPEGGLSVQALDVNGDHAVDLVFATRWLNQPVAVLLNDGHGHFSQAKPGEFVKSRDEGDFRGQAHPWHPVDSAESGPNAPAIRIAGIEEMRATEIERASCVAAVRTPNSAISSLSPRGPPVFLL